MCVLVFFACVCARPGVNLVSNISPDVCVVTSEDKRYFISETDDISNLESSVLENPGDTQLWIKLAFKYLERLVLVSWGLLEYCNFRTMRHTQI